MAYLNGSNLMKKLTTVVNMINEISIYNGQRIIQIKTIIITKQTFYYCI